MKSKQGKEQGRWRYKKVFKMYVFWVMCINWKRWILWLWQHPRYISGEDPPLSVGNWMATHQCILHKDLSFSLLFLAPTTSQFQTAQRHEKALRVSLCDWLTTESFVFVVYTSELMRRVGQIWRLWSEELKPKWSAFIPTGWFKRIICHDWSNFAPPFLLLLREWQLKAEAWWERGVRTNGIVETQTG